MVWKWGLRYNKNNTISTCMKVVITTSFPQTINSGELLMLKDILVSLKEERLIPYETTISEFKILCYERGLNEYRKDLRVFDC